MQQEEEPRRGRSSTPVMRQWPDSEAYSSIFFQNANNSVRVTDEFMHAVERTACSRRARWGAQPVETYKARDLMNKIAEATWQCGDPGMQYDTTINRWHTRRTRRGSMRRTRAGSTCSWIIRRATWRA